MRASDSRLAFVDALKAVASQLIVLHHLAFYGPMSDVVYDLAPALLSWLSHDARIVVQLFLVTGGFLAARALAPDGRLTRVNPFAMLTNRYLKLAIPYFAALLLSVVCAAIARGLMDHDSIPGPPTPWQLLAHIALLQSILAYDSLSAGTWYIAIDFQLFALMLGTLWLAHSLGDRFGWSKRVVGISLVSVLAIASLFHFNRDSSWDSWAIYFFGAYALGALAYWATGSERQPDWLLVIAVVVAAALIVEFRSRIAVALLTALALGISRRWGFIADRPRGRLLSFLGRISYSLFLVHFPVLLVVNALVSHWAPGHVAANAVGVFLAWAASIAAGALFHRFVESRSGRWKVLGYPSMQQAINRSIPVFRLRS